MRCPAGSCEGRPIRRRIDVERGIEVAHTTVLRWVTRYVPGFEKRWNRFSKAVGMSWRVDDTYVSIKAKWHYLYRAVDKHGKTVDFLLRRDRGISAAQAFFRKALSSTQPRVPVVGCRDGSAIDYAEDSGNYWADIRCNCIRIRDDTSRCVQRGRYAGAWEVCDLHRSTGIAVQSNGAAPDRREFERRLSACLFNRITRSPWYRVALGPPRYAAAPDRYRLFVDGDDVFEQRVR